MRKIGIEAVIKLFWGCSVAAISVLIIVICSYQESGGIGAATALSLFNGILMKSALDWVIKRIRNE